MAEKLPEYKIFAIKYATRDARRADHFIGGDPHDGPMPMDYFTWVVVGPDRVFLVDTGFTAETAARRKRTFLRCPIEFLRQLDIDPDAVTDVILTHLHYDHVGNFHKLPHARFHLQEREIAFATGRYLRYPYFRHGFEEEDIVGQAARLLSAEDWESVRAAVPPQRDPLFGEAPDERYRALRERIAAAN